MKEEKVQYDREKNKPHQDKQKKQTTITYINKKKEKLIFLKNASSNEGQGELCLRCCFCLLSSFWVCFWFSFSQLQDLQCYSRVKKKQKRKKKKEKKEKRAPSAGSC